MKIIGKIKEFDGYSGTIIDRDNNSYILIKNELIDKDLKQGDIVTFEPEVFKTVEIEENIARFVRRATKN